VPYSKAGSPLAETSLFVVDVETQARVRIDTGPEAEQYLFVVGWRRDGSEVLFLRLNRRANRLELLAADPEDGQTRVVVTEENDTFVAGLDFVAFDSSLQVTLLDDGRRFLWLSERDGWRHVYLYDLNGRLHNRVTSGAFPVLRVEGVDEEAGRVLVLANGEERLYDSNLYAAPLAGGDLVRLSDGHGKHRVQLSPSLRWFVDTCSSPADPPLSVLRDARDGRLVCTLEGADVSQLEATGWRAPEEFVVKAADGETDLYGVLYTPWNLDPSRRYPVVDFIYQGPFITRVPHTFVAPDPLVIQARALAQVGFVTFIVDGRGTTQRSKAFQDAVYGRIGELEIADHTAALRALAAERPWMDTGHVGIYGHSWGGYYALRAMLTAPEVFHVGIASAPGALTESPTINEPYLGLPSDNPEAYERGRNARLAGNLQGHLVLIHGTADVNAPFSTTMRMVAALVDAGKPHELVVYPGATHFFSGAVWSYQEGVIVRTFCRHLRP